MSDFFQNIFLKILYVHIDFPEKTGYEKMKSLLSPLSPLKADISHFFLYGCNRSMNSLKDFSQNHYLNIGVSEKIGYKEI